MPQLGMGFVKGSLAVFLYSVKRHEKTKIKMFRFKLFIIIFLEVPAVQQL